MENKINETIRELRRQRGISQEVLATALGISVQAISKWETGSSFPDILLLPDIARFFGITIDELFYGVKKQESVELEGMHGIKDDDILRVVQFYGKRCLGAREWSEGKPIYLNIEGLPNTIHMEVWASASIEGDIKGNLNAGNGVNCGNVGGYVDCGNGVNCGNVGGHIDCGNGVNCGNVGGHIDAGGDVRCGNVMNASKIECQNLYCNGEISANEILTKNEIKKSFNC